MTGSFPALCSDLEILPQTRRGKPRGAFLIRDPRTQQVFEMEETEYFLCQQLDGRASLATIQASFETRFETSLPLRDLKEFVHQLENQGLLAGAEPPRRPASVPQARGRPEWRWKWLDADLFLSWLVGRLRWCFNRAFFFCSMPVPLIGLYVLVANWTDFNNAAAEVWNVRHLFLLALIGFFCVAIPHEIAHGLACKYHGGYVPEIGVRFVLRLIPLFYCDVSSAQWLRQRSKRIWVIFAGGYCHLLVWGSAVIGWFLNPPGTHRHTFFLLLATASGLAAFLNWKPWGRRHGGSILSEWSGIRNLRGRALQNVKAWILRRPEPDPLTRRERLGFRVYGLVSSAWLLTAIFALVASVGGSLTKAYRGAGALLFLALVLFVLQGPLSRHLAQPFRWLMASQAGAVTRWFVRLTLLLALVGVMFIPYPYETGGTFTIQPTHKVEIHAVVKGKIIKVMVKEGERVDEGQILAAIDQREYQKELKESQAQLEKTRAELRLLLAGPKPEEVAKAQQLVREAEVKLNFSRPKAKRYEELHKKELIARQQYEDVLREMDVHIEQLEVAKANLELVKSGARTEEIDAKEAEIRRLQALVANYQKELELTALTAPMAGQVITPHVEHKAGQYLKEGDLFAVLEDATMVQAEVEVPEEEIMEVQDGARVKVVTWAYPNKTFLGRVISIAPAAARHSDWATVRVLTELPNTRQLLKSEMSGYAKIAAGRKRLWEVLLRRIIRWFKVEFWFWLP